MGCPDPFALPLADWAVGRLEGRLRQSGLLEGGFRSVAACDPCAALAMTFYELVLQGEAFADAADIEEALTAFREARPKQMTWQELCADPAAAPLIRRYRSFEAFLDNEDAVETIVLTIDMLELSPQDG